MERTDLGLHFNTFIIVRPNLIFGMIAALTFRPSSPQTSTHPADNIFVMEDKSSNLVSSQQRLETAPCANTKEVDGLMVNCDNEASLVCSQCFLVKVRGDPNIMGITSR